LGDELDQSGYRLHPDSPITSKTDISVADDIVDLIDQRLTAFRRLLNDREVDIAHCTVFYINVLQHYFWRGYRPRERGELSTKHIVAIREI